MEKLLEIKNLSTIASDDNNKHILNGLNLTINKGETHVIMGPNGAGKSTLANTVLASPRYIVTSGDIFFEGENINKLNTSERAKKGIFMSFQTPEEIPGISVASFLKTAKGSQTGSNVSVFAFAKEIESKMKELNMDSSFGQREMNVGFSGGEKKKNEILQLLMLNPKLAMLDETDSGLDVDAVKIVSKGINLYKNKDNAVLIITHSLKMLKDIDVDYVHILVDGKIVTTGNRDLALKIEENGYKDYL
jgi:Fe-S cluster assembly ATP-binding protein